MCSLNLIMSSSSWLLLVHHLLLDSLHLHQLVELLLVHGVQGDSLHLLPSFIVKYCFWRFTWVQTLFNFTMFLVNMNCKIFLNTRNFLVGCLFIISLELSHDEFLHLWELKEEVNYYWFYVSWTLSPCLDVILRRTQWQRWQYLCLPPHHWVIKYENCKILTNILAFLCLKSIWN